MMKKNTEVAEIRASVGHHKETTVKESKRAVQSKAQ